jgi:arabinan endo-1,5-alpha-L-arabinosidase
MNGAKMSRSRRCISTVALLGAIAANTFAVEGVLDGMPDPSIIQDTDGTFYIFATGPGLPIYRSHNLVEWDKVDRVFADPVPAWARQAVPGTEGIWAPEVARLNDRFYVYYSVSTFGSQRSVIGVAVNTTLNPDSANYRWEDLGLVVESSPRRTPFNAIDAAAFQNEDGRAYLVWGSYFGGIMLAPLDPATGKLVENADPILVAARAPGGPDAIEAPYLTRRGDYYYLWLSWDWCCGGAESTYKVMIGRSHSPTGPFLDHTGKDLAAGGGTLVLANNDNWRGPAHNSVAKTETGDWMAHHTYDTLNLHKHRIGQVRPIYWTADGWPVAGEPLSEKNPMHTGPVTIDPGQLHGSWRISVNYTEGEIIDLIPQGRVAFDRSASWSFNEGKLTLRRAFNQYTVFVEPGANSFVGRNAAGDVIRGVKIK